MMSTKSLRNLVFTYSSAPYRRLSVSNDGESKLIYPTSRVHPALNKYQDGIAGMFTVKQCFLGHKTLYVLERKPVSSFGKQLLF